MKLVIKFSPILIKHCPTALVESWISLEKKIDPRHLIPALTHYQPQSTNPAVSRRFFSPFFSLSFNATAADLGHNCRVSLLLETHTSSLLILPPGYLGHVLITSGK